MYMCIYIYIYIEGEREREREGERERMNILFNHDSGCPSRRCASDCLRVSLTEELGLGFRV